MKHIIALSVWISLLIIPTFSYADMITFTDAEDSYIKWTHGILQHNDNHGSSAEIETANNGIFDTYGLIKFDNVFGAGSNQVSANTTITSAELHLWMSRETDYWPNIIYLYQLNKDWDENTVTGTSYGGLNDSSHDNTTGAAIASYSKATDNNAILPQELTFDVTASLLDWQAVAGATNFGWGIESATLHEVNYFFSSESGGNYTPSLVLNYDAAPSSVPEPATMLFFGIGLAWLVGVKFRRKKK